MLKGTALGREKGVEDMEGVEKRRRRKGPRQPVEMGQRYEAGYGSRESRQGQQSGWMAAAWSARWRSRSGGNAAEASMPLQQQSALGA